MKHTLWALSWLLALPLADAQVIKVDFEKPGSNSSQCTAVGYEQWMSNNAPAVSQTIGGVTVTLRSDDGSDLKFDWYKAGTQNKPASNLVNDGVRIDDYTRGAGIELVLSGLAAGSHTLQTYNNSWENGDAFEFPPFDAYLNGEKVYSAVVPSCRVAANEDATRLFFTFAVGSPADEVVVRFKPVADYVPTQNKPNGLYNTAFLNGFELGVGNASAQASRPHPADADEHADCDTAAVLTWTAAADAVGHYVMLSADSAEVAADGESGLDVSTERSALLTDTSYVVRQKLSSHQTYYWRVDEVAADGTVTRGEVWSFRPRHRAFRTAEGYGQWAIGGRGGKVVHVTNLNDDGPGSLREALTNDIGPRTIVFDVSGIIHLQSRLVQVGRYVTVAGQTAPGRGICLATSTMGIGSDAIWRHIRVRHGSGETGDGIGITGQNHSILDHASISWSIDEAFSSRGAQNFTLQRCLISEALNVAGHKNYPAGTAHGYAGSVGGDIASLHHNLLAHCSGRNWSMAGGVDGDNVYTGRLDIFNNVVYNWATRTTDGGAHEVNFVGNYYKRGAAYEKPDAMLVAEHEGGHGGTQSYYFHNNILARADGTPIYDGTNDTQGRTRGSKSVSITWQDFVDAPFFPSYATVEPAADAYGSVLADVGCTMPVLDDHDQRVVRETLTGTYTYRGSNTGKPGLPDTEQDVGGYEDYGTEVRPAGFDTDGDGLPDWWETLHGSDTHSAAGDFSDANADPDGDGYTALEDYLEYMARPHYEVVAGHSIAVSLPDVVQSTYGEPRLTGVSVENPAVVSAAVAADGESIAVSAPDGARGVTFVDAQGIDTSGSVFTIHLAVSAVATSGDGIVELRDVASTVDSRLYALDGVQRDVAQRGVNIVVLPDGTSRKVFVP